MKKSVEQFRAHYFELKSRNKYTQQQVADLVGCSRASIASFECGRSPMPEGSTTLGLVKLLYPCVDSDCMLLRSSICPHCAEAIPGVAEGASYCMKCGVSIADRCHECGAPLIHGSLYCSHCGVSTLSPERQDSKGHK